MSSKYYTVKELSKLAGVSIKTLHHYDKLGLLKPKFRTDVGYRYYTEKELYLLQQILIYKALEFSLKDIFKILNSNNFELLEALESQKETLKSKQRNIQNIINTINKTIIHLKEGSNMSHKDIYEGLPNEFSNKYRDESIHKWGKNSIIKSENYLNSIPKEQRVKMLEKMKTTWSKLFSLLEQEIDSKIVQDEIHEFYNLIREFWGTRNLKDKQKNKFIGLGELYTIDDRYSKIDNIPRPEFAKFLREAIYYYANKNL